MLVSEDLSLHIRKETVHTSDYYRAHSVSKRAAVVLLYRPESVLNKVQAQHLESFDFPPKGVYVGGNSFRLVPPSVASSPNPRV